MCSASLHWLLGVQGEEKGYEQQESTQGRFGSREYTLYLHHGHVNLSKDIKLHLKYVHFIGCNYISIKLSLKNSKV